MASDYRFSSAFVARVMGAVLVLAGAVVLVLALLVWLVDLPRVVLSVGVVLALLGFLSTGLLLTRGAVVVRLGDDG